jgi:two-component system, OmpR family, phosphate regulon response regulator PhoB
MPPLILICSRDPEFCMFAGHIFRMDGYETTIAENVEEAVQHVEAGTVSAAILDSQPNSSLAAAICSQLRLIETARELPILALVTPGSQDNYLELLKAGVHQAVIRPIAPEWLLTYLRSALTPFVGAPRQTLIHDGVISFGDVQILTQEYRVQHRDGADIMLSPIEFKLLCELLKIPGKVLSREDLIRAAWPQNIFVELRTVDVHIGRLRRILARATGKNLIRTVRLAGYAAEQPS